MRYHVRALRNGGELAALTFDADTEAAARNQATSQGLSVLSVRAERRSLPRPFRARSKFPLLLFTQEFISLLDAGLGATEALEALAGKEGAGGALRAVLGHVSAGRSLSYAFEQGGADFPPLFVATIRASEKTGDMKEALSRYAAYFGQVESLRKKVVNALVYPAMLAVTGGLVTAFLMFYVVPRFSRIYEDIGGNLPFLSQILMKWGQLLSNHATALFLSLAALALIVVRVGSRPQVRERLMRAAWRAPRIGEALQVYHLARFYRTMGMLLRSGMPLVGALGMARGLLAPAMRPSLDAASRSISEGIPASTALTECGLTTPVGLSMLRVGE
ncbi:MAG TPA: type II secretion system F family protein, partial [Usitatibacteraceae bacterium]|nr:type II secretion system F family protein [Usitatibacteraceae bacterium]